MSVRRSKSARSASVLSPPEQSATPPVLPHRQVNRLPGALFLSTAATVAVGLAVGIGIGGTSGLWPIVAALAVFFALTWVFSEMTVTVDDREVAWRFRHGLLARRLIIPDIREAEQAYVSWLYGYGYRWTTKGPLYRAWGLDVVRIHRKSGRPVHLGATEPEAIIAAIHAAQARWLEETDRPD
jgi:hypothetical protein